MTQLLVKDWNGQPIWQVDFQQTSAPTQTCSTSSQSMLVTYDLTCEDAPIPFAQSAWNYVLVLVLAMLGILAAYVLASIQYQPLGNLIQKINKKVKGKNEQQDIDTLATCVGRLYDDHTNMENTIAAYRYALREQTNAQLLRGYFNSDQQSVPSSCNYWYVVVVFRHQPGNPDNETEDTRIHLEFLLTLKKSLQTIKCGQSHCELVENIDECTAVIAEFPSLPDEDIAMELAQPLYDALIEEDIECSVFVARARRGLTGISAAYQEIKESMREKKGICGIQFANPNMEYYYPLDWETQLVRAIREGSEKRAQAILQQLYEENQRLGLSYTLICRVATLLYETMRRIILEEKLPVQMFLKMEEPQHGMTLEQAFDRARNTVNTLCEHQREPLAGELCKRASARPRSVAEFAERPFWRVQCQRFPHLQKYGGTKFLQLYHRKADGKSQGTAGAEGILSPGNCHRNRVRQRVFLQACFPAHLRHHAPRLFGKGREKCKVNIAHPDRIQAESGIWY